MDKNQKTLEQVQEIDIKLLMESAMNPRMDFGNGELEKSIRDQGVLVPLVVRQVKDKYEIVDGARRYRNAGMVGLENLPCVVREITDAQIPELMFDANVHKNLKPAELGTAFKAMNEIGNMTVKDIAKKAELAEAEVYMMMKLTMLPDSVQRLINIDFVSRDIYKDLVKMIGYPIIDWVKEKLDEMYKRETEAKNNYQKDKDDVVVEPLTRTEWHNALSEKLRKTQEDSMILDHLGPDHFGPEWMKKFDAKKCKACKVPVELDGNDRVCLKSECWKPQAREAKRAVKAQKVLEKADPRAVQDLDKLKHGTYEDMEGASFDMIVCARCPDKKTGKRSWGGSQTVCVYKPCFDKMESAAEKEIAKRVKDFNEELIKTRDAWLTAKPDISHTDVLNLISKNIGLKLTKKGAIEDQVVKGVVLYNIKPVRAEYVDKDDIKTLKKMSFLKDIKLDIAIPKMTPTRRPESEKEEKKELAPGVKDKPKKKAGRPKKFSQADADGDDEGDNDE